MFHKNRKMHNLPKIVMLLLKNCLKYTTSITIRDYLK